MDLWRYDYLSGTSSSAIVSFFHEREKRDLIHAIRNGLGFKDVITYENLNHRIYDYTVGWKYLLTKAEEEAFPLQDISLPVIVVKESKSSNGLGNDNLTQYSYKGAKRHVQGKGFLGFTEVSIFGVDDRSRVVNSCEVDRSYYLMKSHRQTEYCEQEDNPIVCTAPDVETGADQQKAQAQSAGTGLVSDKVEETGVQPMTIQSNTFTLTLRETAFCDTIINYGNKRIFIAPKLSTFRDANNGLFKSTFLKYNNEGNVISKKERYSNYSGGPLSFENLQTFVYGSFGSYGINNKIIQVTDTSRYGNDTPFSRSIEYNYDAKGNLIQQVSDPGKTGAITKTFIRGISGVVDSDQVSATGVSSRTTSYSYDSKFRFVTGEVNQLGQTRSMTFDPGTGHILTSTDINTLMTEYGYDGQGRNISIKTPDGNQTTITYSHEYSGYKVTTARAGTPQSSVTYDILNRERASSLQRMASVNYGSKNYNKHGYLTSENIIGSPVTHYYSYDSRGRVDTIKDNYDLKTTVEYDYGRGEYHYPDGSSRRIVTDGVGNKVSVYENSSQVISYSYSSNRGVKSITTPGKTINFGYDEYGRKTSATNPNSGTTGYQYDNFGQLKKITDSGNDSITYTYDGIGRLAIEAVKGVTTNYVYYTSGTANGKIAAIEKGDTIQAYKYDSLGRLIRVADSLPGISMVTKYEYDAYGRNSTITYPSGIVLTNIYNVNGYLEEIKNGSQTLWKLNSENYLV